jgi:hypothetical protein
MQKKIKITKQLKEKFIPFVKKFRALEEDFYLKVSVIEEDMSHKTGIKGLGFFQGFDGDYVAIGNASRTLPLIYLEELEEKK